MKVTRTEDTYIIEMSEQEVAHFKIDYQRIGNTPNAYYHTVSELRRALAQPTLDVPFDTTVGPNARRAIDAQISTEVRA